MIIGRKGTVNYSVLVNDKNKEKLIRSNANQIKRRFNNEDRINSTHLLLEMFDLHNTLSVSQDSKSDSNLDVLNHSSLENNQNTEESEDISYTINLKRNLHFTPRLVQ